MTKLAWSLPGQRFFEAGVDRGVLFPRGMIGVPWNGLIAINEAPGGGDPKPLYLDGIKFMTVSSAEEFKFSIEAYSAPREFALCDGAGMVAAGLFITNQPRKAFDFTYRTGIGNEIDGLDLGYKLHLVYNALAGPSERTNPTLQAEVTPNEFKWDITTTPVNVPGIKQTAHLVIDSRRADLVALGYLEGILYGAEGIDPRMPDVDEVMAIMGMPNTGVSFAVNLLGHATSGVGSVISIAPNPSGENMSGLTEVRRNYHVNPGAVNPNGLGEWAGPAGNTSTTSNVDCAWSISGKAYQSAWTAVADAGSGGVQVRLNGVVTATGRWTIAYTVLSSVSGQTAASTGNVPAGTTTVAVNNPDLVANTPARGYVTFDFTTIPTDPIARWHIDIRNKVVGTIAQLSDIDVYQGNYQPTREVFYGDTPDEGDYVYIWTSTVNNSASVQRANKPTSFDGSAVKTVRSSEWSVDGNYSVLIVADGDNNDSNASLGGQSTTSMNAGLIAGKTYTFVATSRMLTPQVGTLHAAARRMEIAYNNISGWTNATTVRSVVAPNDAHVVEHRVTVALPSDTVWARIRFFNGASAGNGDIWWDDVAVVEVPSTSAPYTGPAFNGGKSSVVYKTQEIKPEWLSSNSVLEYYTLLETPGNIGDAHVIEGNIWVFTDEGYWKNVGPDPLA